MAKRLGITLQDEVFKILEEDAKRYGLSMSGYLAQLVMKQNMEMTALRMVNSLTDQQLREQIKLQLGDK